MISFEPFSICQLSAKDLALMEELLAVFGEAFEEVDRYSSSRPSHTYLKRLLSSHYFIALAALKNGSVVGGLVAYELQKLQQSIDWRVNFLCLFCEKDVRGSIVGFSNQFSELVCNFDVNSHKTYPLVIYTL
jgi:hypothetical protein